MFCEIAFGLQNKLDVSSILEWRQETLFQL